MKKYGTAGTAFFDMVKEQDEEIGSVLEENEYKMCSGKQCMSGSVDRNHSTILCPFAPTSSDWCRKTTQFADSIACKEIDLVSTIGDPQATSVTEERLDLWKTGWSSVKHIPKEVQSESMLKLFVGENIAPHGSDKSASDDWSNVQISGSIVDGQEVVVSASSLALALSLSLSLSCPVLSCPVLSCPVLSCPVLSCPVLSCPVLSCLVLSCLVLSCLVLSCLVLSCLALSCLVLSCLVLSCLVLPCLVLSCLVLSCLVLSCPV